MPPLNRIAIILPFNDIAAFHGGSRNGIKSKIAYFDQFLMLYQSIIDQWRKKNFTYTFTVLHSVPFDDQKTKILKQLDVNVIQVDFEEHATKIRPVAYTMDIECDFRLILDIDMIALKEPDFDFTSDVQAVYGGNKYNKRQWMEICAFLGCKFPDFTSLKFRSGRYPVWRFLEHYLYQTGWNRRRIFPYFNNGAVLINNNLAHELGNLWLEYRRQYTRFVEKTQGIDIDLDGQDVIGLAINQVTDNWAALPYGFNYILQNKFYLGRRMSSAVKDYISLFHYIYVEDTSPFYKIIKNYYLRIRERYYGDKPHEKIL